ncbi:hypothetical protein GR183_02210 [Stappia sp. GBMRC 2046]|uniref:Flagellin n=1 Tax=Stappia sediminis TaxID=2692190 RepID=A0A7X3S663_9HYPH|nr:hypothetical protein [Stappia sediminis]MXN63705.1 hypothetical protein [Stappia sediminis]
MTVFNSTYSLPPQFSYLTNLRSQFDELQRQLATERRTDTYGGLGGKSGLDLTLKQQRSEIGVYKDTIDVVDLRLSVLDRTSTRLEDLRIDSKAAVDPNGFELFTNGRTSSQTATEIQLRDFIAQLNQNVGGRYLFSGRASDKAPVPTLERILEGDADEAGLKQVISEYNAADFGPEVNLGPGYESAHLGRLETDLTGSVFTLSEDAAAGAHPFGLKLASVQSGLSNVGVTDNYSSPGASPRSVELDFTGQPEPGETVRLFFTLPDGTEREIRIGVEGETQDNPEFTFQIGATANDTALNFKATLERAISTVARTDLKAASTVVATENFFDTAPRLDGSFGPQRVQPGPGGFEDATAIATDVNNTVNWYQGENGADSARRTTTGTVDENLTVDYGARANERGYREVVQSLAAFVAADFSAQQPDNQDFYSALAERLNGTLSQGDDGISGIRQNHIEFAAAQTAAKAAKDRHKIADATIDGVVAGIEGISSEEVAAKLLRVQTVLQSSYQTTRIAADLSLSNYL